MFVQQTRGFLLLFGVIFAVSLSSADAEVYRISYVSPQRTRENEAPLNNVPEGSIMREDCSDENFNSVNLASLECARNVTRTTDASGYLSMNEARVHLEVISPNIQHKVSIETNIRRSMIIGSIIRSVYVDGKLVVEDSRRLGFRRTFQKRADGSMWYTNLPVGKPMTEREIQQFEKDAEEKRRLHEELQGGKQTESKTTEKTDPDASTDSGDLPHRQKVYKTDRNFYLNMHDGGVDAQLISPNKTQTLEFRPGGIAVNDHFIKSYRFGSSPTYQVGEDGARWYTNLPMVRSMEEDEIAQFRKDVDDVKRYGGGMAQEVDSAVLEQEMKNRKAAKKQKALEMEAMMKKQEVVDEEVGSKGDEEMGSMGDEEESEAGGATASPDMIPSPSLYYFTPSGNWE